MEFLTTRFIAEKIFSNKTQARKIFRKKKRAKTVHKKKDVKNTLLVCVCVCVCVCEFRSKSMTLPKVASSGRLGKMITRILDVPA